MKSMFRSGFRIFLAYLMLSMGAFNGFGNQERVTAKGEGATFDGAKQAALRNAIERGVGLVIHSETLSHNGQIIRDQMIAKVQGYAKDFYVVDKKETEDGWEVEVSAEVDFLSKLQADMVSVAGMLDQLQYPRIMVVIDELIDNEPVKTWSVTTAIEEYFLGKGFDLVHAAQVRENRLQEMSRAAENPDLAAELGRLHNREIVVVGKALAEFAESRNPWGVEEQHFYTANLNLKIVEVSNAKVLASAFNMAKRASSTKMAGAQFAMREAVGGIAEKLFLQATCTWSRQIYERKEYEVVVIGTEDSTLEEIRNAIQEGRNVKSVSDATLSEGIGHFRVQMIGSLSELKGIVRVILKQIETGITMESPTPTKLVLRMGEPEKRHDMNKTELKPSEQASEKRPDEAEKQDKKEEEEDILDADLKKQATPPSKDPGSQTTDLQDGIKPLAKMVFIVAIGGAFAVLVAIVVRRKGGGVLSSN